METQVHKLTIPKDILLFSLGKLCRKVFISEDVIRKNGGYYLKNI